MFCLKTKNTIASCEFGISIFVGLCRSLCTRLAVTTLCLFLTSNYEPVKILVRVWEIRSVAKTRQITYKKVVVKKTTIALHDGMKRADCNPNAIKGCTSHLSKGRSKGNTFKCFTSLDYTHQNVHLF